MPNKALLKPLKFAKKIPEKIISRISECHYDKILTSSVSAKNAISFYGMRRSGNHAVAEWLLRCLSQCDERVNVQLKLVAYGNSCYVNAINQYSSSMELRADLQFVALTYENILITHEDVSTCFSTKYTHGLKKIVVIRDIRDLVASRLKSMSKALKKNQHYFQIDDKFFSRWLEHASAQAKNKIVLIKFEEWVSSAEYQEQICDELGVKNFRCPSTVTNHGGGSSFSGKEKVPTSSELSSRRHQIDIPEYIQARINSSDIKDALERLGYI